MFVLKKRKSEQYLTVNGEFAGLYAHREWKFYDVFVTASQDAMKLDLDLEIVSAVHVIHALAETILRERFNEEESKRGIKEWEEKLEPN